MTGLETAAAGLLWLAANVVQCDLPHAPQIEIRPTTSQIVYDNSKTVAELSQMKSDTISPYGMHAEVLQFGQMVGEMRITGKTTVGSYSYPSLNVSCLYYDKVEIELSLKPVIYIAKEFRPGSCGYNVIREHELKHVRVDRIIANKYAREIGVAIRDAVNRAGALGPYQSDRAEEINQSMQQYIGSVISSQELLIAEEQARLQQDVDSLEEYESSSRKLREGCGLDLSALR